VSAVLLWAGVGVLGGCGALARYALDAVVSARAGGRFPAGTLVVNVTGSVLLGLLTGLALHGDALLLAGTALLGAFTTFSTWMFETHRLAEDGEGRAAALNVAVSLGLGILAVLVGRWIG
jgi:CrcB protein